MKKLVRKIGLMVLSVLLISCGITDPKTEEKHVVPEGTTAVSFENSSIQMAYNCQIGWNLGNTLDAGGTNDRSYSLGVDTETFWGQPKTTENMIKTLAKAGFKTIRIPVSWHNHISKNDTTNYTIDSQWMNRVRTIVDWSISNGLIVILNIHHDNFSVSEINSNPGFCISSTPSIQTKSKNFISKVWSQVATEFKDYDAALVFEVLNEPRCVGTNTEWWTNDKSIINIITDYEQSAVNAIRAAGGNNDKRFIMVPGYAASNDSSMLGLYSLPNDSADDKLILSVHAYSPYDFAMESPGTTSFTSNHENQLNTLFNFLYGTYVSEGIGVIIGEAGATDKNNLAEREKWFTYFFEKAYQKGMPTVLWDNGSIYNGGSNYSEKYGYYNRTAGTWHFPSLIKKAMGAVGVTDYEIN